MPDARDHIRHLAGLFLTRTPRTDGAREPDDEMADAAPDPAELRFDVSTARRSDSSISHSGVRTSAPFIECILVGHLPVRAGLWLTQYADEVAREHGPTGLIRLDPDQHIMEILRSDERVARAASAANLHEAVTHIAAGVSRWIIRAEPGDSLSTLLRSQPDVVTILSSADEFAVVACFRAIKDLCETARSDELPLPSIEIAILGARPEQARLAGSKISHAARESLGITVALRRCVPSMGPLGSTLHFRFPATAGEDRGLANLLEAIRSALEVEPLAASDAHTGGADEIATTSISTSARLPLDRGIKEPVMSDLTHEPPATADLRPVATGDSGRPAVLRHGGSSSGSSDPSRLATPLSTGAEERIPGSAERPAAASPIRMPPKPSIHIEPKSKIRRGGRMVPTPTPRATPPARALTTWIGGLAPLPVRCPDAPEVEIAADTHGHLHLIAWEDGLRPLALAEGWTRKHREIIRQACSDHAIRSEGDLTRHVFTAEPAAVADLHGSGLRLHVLAAIEVEGRSGWYAAPLNA